jgi:hypothetical protein
MRAPRWLLPALVAAAIAGIGLGVWLYGILAGGATPA